MSFLCLGGKDFLRLGKTGWISSKLRNSSKKHGEASQRERSRVPQYAPRATRESLHRPLRVKVLARNLNGSDFKRELFGFASK